MEGLEPSIFRFGDGCSTLEPHSLKPTKSPCKQTMQNMIHLQGPSRKAVPP